jgi:cytochrome c5
MKKIVLIGLLLCLCSCGSQLYIPTESKANISVENLQEGRKIYVNNCASCHQLYAPNKYKSGDWQKKLDWMQPRAKITDDQKQLIYNYLVNAPK